MTQAADPFGFLLQVLEAHTSGEVELTLPRTPFIEQALRDGHAHSVSHPDLNQPALERKTMTPYERVREHFDFPFELRPYQFEEVNRLAEGDPTIYVHVGDKAQGMGSHGGHYDEPGTGKTAISTHHALYRMLATGIEHWVVLVPAPDLLVPQWARWLRSIKRKSDGKALTVTEYVGAPKKRAGLDLTAQFLVMSYEMFKNDWEKLWYALEGKKVGGLADEGHKLKNEESAIHKAFYQFFEGRDRQVLTGTPLTKPEDAFAYCRLIAPGRYRNRRHFDKLHVAEVDGYDKPVKYDNLDVLAESMTINASRILRREVQSQLPKVQYIPRPYSLSKNHQELYEQLAVQKLVEFEDGSEINAISESALYNALQQVIVNWAEFDEDPTVRPRILGLIDETMDELGDGAKLAVVAHYQRSNAYLLRELAKYGAVAVYGAVTAKQKLAAIDRFKDDPSCRIILLQPTSAGVGLDGLQHVCSEMLMVEAPTTPSLFHQVVARLDRDGQVNPVNCRIAIAQRTCQVKRFKGLLKRDAQINSIQGGYKDLKRAVLEDVWVDDTAIALPAPAEEREEELEAA